MRGYDDLIVSGFSSSAFYSGVCMTEFSFELWKISSGVVSLDTDFKAESSCLLDCL